jgi:hypothetical protein
MQGQYRHGNRNEKQLRIQTTMKFVCDEWSRLRHPNLFQPCYCSVQLVNAVLEHYGVAYVVKRT